MYDPAQPPVDAVRFGPDLPPTGVLGVCRGAEREGRRGAAGAGPGSPTGGGRTRRGWLVAACLLSLSALGCGGGDGADPVIPPDPALTSVTPAEGLVDGGEAVTLAGSGFSATGAGTTIVRFGGIDATSIVVVNDTTITCVAPAHSAGAVLVEVKNGNGWAELAAGYLYREPPVTFVQTGGTAVWSSQVERTAGVTNIRFETPDAVGGSKAILPFTGTLGSLTEFSYWVYSNTANYAPFIRIALDHDMDPSTVEVILRCEPVITTGWGALPANTWTQFDVLQMRCEAWELDGAGNITNHVDCPFDAPTVAEYISGAAMAQGNTCADPNAWSTFAYGSLVVIEIGVQAGPGGPWTGVIAYADSITIDGRTFAEGD